MMNYLTKLNEKMYAILVVDYTGIVAELAYNADITTVTDIELWFNFNKLGESARLVRYTRENGKLWAQELTEDSRSEWVEVSC